MASNDPILDALLSATDADAGDRALEALVVGRVRPLVARILGRYRAGALVTEDVEDLMAAIDVRVVRRLQQLGDEPANAIASLDDYVAMVAYNAVHDFLRSRHPERARLKNRLRYLFTHDPAFALWETDRGSACGFAAWRGRRAVATDAVAAGGSNLLSEMRTLFERVGGPLLLDEVVTLVGETMGLVDPAFVSASEDRASVATTPESELILRQEVRTLWEGVQLLPPNQRAALLLNLRDADGRNALGLLVLVGIATIDEIAGAIGMTAERLAELWRDLPLDDLSIASTLGLTRQQVANLRKSARERLARHQARRNQWR